jgi:hypothetical protein
MIRLKSASSIEHGVNNRGRLTCPASPSIERDTAQGRAAKGPGCAKTPARVHADLFCSLFRALRAFRSKKIAKNFALLSQPQKIAVFSHSLGRNFGFAAFVRNRRSGRKARLHGELREGPQFEPKPPFHYERGVCFSARRRHWSMHQPHKKAGKRPSVVKKRRRARQKDGLRSQTRCWMGFLT